MYSTEAKQEMAIPVACPRCDGKLVVISWDAVLNFLKNRSWMVCKNCSFEQSVEQYKNGLWTV